MPSNHLILYHPLLLPPSIFPSIRVFSSESVLCIRWPKYWSFSLSISPSSEYSGLISFRTDWFDLFASKALSKSSPTPQFKNVNQYHNQSTPQSKASINKKQKNDAFTYSTMTEMNCHAIDINCGLQSMGLQRVGHGWMTNTTTTFLIPVLFKG